MSNFSEIGSFPGRKPVRLPEKSNFSQTCSMLSHYLKEKGSFGDLTLGMTCNLEEKEKSETFGQMTEKKMNNLLPNTKISGDYPVVPHRSGAASSSCKVKKSMDLFPQDAGFGSTLSMEDVPKKAVDFRPVKEPETAPQMTIFYAGKVLVFDNFPQNKVKEIMQLATSNLTSSPVTQTNGTSASTTVNGNGNDQQLNSSSGLNASASNFPSGINNSTKESSVQAKLSGLPIARKASLHRFLEKRKDRIGARAPYEVNSLMSGAPPPAKAEESKMWLGLASESSKPFDLQL
ncbi:Tify [Macleaya cordata]|uniref:Protein TIFY n=1 Tax=Macleaya cordata TaxID=56857 RepID=A0A200QCX6_MACCD|nr:Tify [Macleaya cordata]